ncbi:MAG: serine hydrolase domain-containing protein [Microbulbifer sp.]
MSKLDAYIEKLIETGHLPGATLLVARHGKVVKFDAYGKTDVRDGKPMQRDAIFRIYSQTKPVTGVALMILFEEGKWRFDDPVTKFLPEFAGLRVFKEENADGSMQLEDLERAPTMRELLTHSAGFGYGLSTDHPVEKAYRDSDFMRAANAREAIEKIAGLPLVSQPGKHWRYSAAVDIQGYIVERLSGQSLADFMRTRIFEPLGMNDTDFHLPADKTHRLVSLNTYDPATKGLAPATGGMVLDYSKPPGTASGGAGLVSTTNDYARFAQMILNGGELDGARILSPSSVRLMTSNHLADSIRAIPGEPYTEESGFGFAVDFAVVTDTAKAGTTQGLGTLSWGGAAGSWFWIDPTNDLFVLGMIQVLNRWEAPALQNIDTESSALIYGALVAPEK